MCERALADPSLRPSLRARLLAQSASVLADAGRGTASTAHATEALTLAEESGDPQAVIDAVRARMKAHPTALPREERLRLGMLAIEHASVTGQPLAELWGAKWRIDAALETGDLATVDDELARVRALAQRTRLPLVRWHDLRLRASVSALHGRFPEALALNEQARLVGATELAQDLSAAGMSGAFLYQYAMVTGKAADLDSEAVALMDLADDVPIVQASRTVVALVAGRRDEAEARYAALRPRLTDPDFVESAGVAETLVPLVEEFGDAAAAEALGGSSPRSAWTPAARVSTAAARRRSCSAGSPRCGAGGTRRSRTSRRRCGSTRGPGPGPPPSTTGWDWPRPSSSGAGRPTCRGRVSWPGRRWRRPGGSTCRDRRGGRPRWSRPPAGRRGPPTR
ncbi:hypothetical protein [Blastococcus brunescens]|uniref:Uncharacterized protein n=1 Tax=Blastococcus brunescens TaxID=1564165 RepID=A0ABZ1AXZ1_9ACTN|nr:hypothetical protein [Blastococcus sp. BMG 8361]WRL61984.1 hypothetical protein U6N30_18050 [Blastococcus sp. BMG 8361]